jgi:hypothetical protein
MNLKAYEPNFLWDEPCEFKGTMVYPALMREHHVFYTALQCIDLPKNRSKDIKVIKMLYFDYLFHLALENEENQIYIILLTMLLTVVFKNQDVRLIDFENGAYGIGVSKDGEEIALMAEDFDDLKELIIAQNAIELPDVELNEEIEAELEKARRLKEAIEKKSPSASLEEVVTSFMVYSGIPIEQIKNMTIRKFNRAIQRMSLLEDYRVYKSAEVSGMVEFKQSIPHWLSKYITEEKDKDLKMAPESVSSMLKDVANFTKEMKLDGTE